jgi:IS30 family transposase
LVIGKNGKTAVATVVERTSRFLILVPLTGRNSLTVTDATDGLPAQIRRSLSWDCGAEMARHAAVTATGLPVFFAHPHSPWERGSNENLEPDRQGIPPERRTNHLGPSLSRDGRCGDQRPAS